MQDLVYGFKNRISVKDLIEEMKQEVALESGKPYPKPIDPKAKKPVKPIKKPKRKKCIRLGNGLRYAKKRK